MFCAGLWSYSGIPEIPANLSFVDVPYIGMGDDVFLNVSSLATMARCMHMCMGARVSLYSKLLRNHNLCKWSRYPPSHNQGTLLPSTASTM